LGRSVHGTSDGGLMTRTSRRTLGGMTAQIGYDGLDARGDPRPELLIDVAGVQPGPGRDWVHLGRLGFRSTQRLWIGDVPGGVAVATWPAELKPQACYLYGGGLGSALVAAAIERGWAVEPSPHIAFRTASAARRLYMSPRSVEPRDYVACWEDEDGLSRVGGNYARGAVEHELWPWLKQMGFADDGDDAVLRRFLDEFLGNWPANMRPGLRFFRVWALDEAAELGPALADTIRSQFDAVFAVAHEPALQAARHSRDALHPGTGNRPAGTPRPVQRPDPLTCTLTGPTRVTRSRGSREPRQRRRRRCMLDWYQATGTEARDGRSLRTDEAPPASGRSQSSTPRSPRTRCGTAAGKAASARRGRCSVTRASLRRMLSAEALQGGLGRDYESAALGYVTRTDLSLT
jgi:hypothetical protein